MFKPHILTYGADINAKSTLCGSPLETALREKKDNVAELLRERGASQFPVSTLALEVGEIGAGSVLEAQGSMLELFGRRGPGVNAPGRNV